MVRCLVCRPETDGHIQHCWTHSTTKHTAFYNGLSYLAQEQSLGTQINGGGFVYYVQGARFDPQLHILIHKPPISGCGRES